MELLTEDNLQEKIIDAREKLIINNRTRKFLLPLLGSMDPSWIAEVNKFYSVAVGLADGKYYPYLEEPSILLLKNVKSSRIDSFNESLDLIKKNPYFIKDYIFADAIDSWLHMFVVRIPKNFENAYNYFLQSKYSMMYNDTQKKRFFTPNRTKLNWQAKKKVREILDKSPSAKTELELKLNVAIPEQAELDSKIDLNYEVFNYEDNTFISVNQQKLEFNEQQ